MKPRDKHKEFSLSSKAGFVALFLLAIFFGNLKYNQYKTKKAIEREKQNLISQANSLGKKNRELGESLNYLNSKNFKEKIAREQLNLKKEGESVYSFTESKTLQGNSLASDINTKTNYEKWLEYFFNN